MGLDDISAEDLTGTNTTVVWALGTGETTNGPAIWSVVHVEQGVLLLETEPWLLVLVRLHELVGLVAVVVLVGGSIGIPAFTDDEDVGGFAERVREDGDRAEVDIRVVAWSLARRAAVEVPLWEILDLEFTAGRDLWESLARHEGLISICVEWVVAGGGSVGASPLTLSEPLQLSQSRCTWWQINQRWCADAVTDDPYSAIALPF